MGKRNAIFKDIANRLESEFKMEAENARSFAKQALVEHRNQGCDKRIERFNSSFKKLNVFS